MVETTLWNPHGPMKIHNETQMHFVIEYYLKVLKEGDIYNCA